MIWLWDACATEPVTYMMSEYLIQPPAWVERCYLDPELVCIEEAVYQAPGLVVRQETPFTFLEDSGILPPVGGVVLVDVQAKDEAGNASMGECP